MRQYIDFESRKNNMPFSIYGLNLHINKLKQNRISSYNDRVVKVIYYHVKDVPNIQKCIVLFEKYKSKSYI